MLEIKAQVENPEPDWSLLMFWEDITAILVIIGDWIRSLISALN